MAQGGDVVLWRDVCAHVAGMLSIPERTATQLVELASDALAVAPAFRVLDGTDGPRYLTFTGAQTRQIRPLRH